MVFGFFLIEQMVIFLILTIWTKKRGLKKPLQKHLLLFQKHKLAAPNRPASFAKVALLI